MTAYVAQPIILIEGLDKGIAPWVEILRAYGVETFESCEGGSGHAFRAPTIRFFGGPGDGHHAYAIARTFAMPVDSIQRVWSETNGELTGPQWEIVFRSKAGSDQKAQLAYVIEHTEVAS